MQMELTPITPQFPLFSAKKKVCLHEMITFMNIQFSFYTQKQPHQEMSCCRMLRSSWYIQQGTSSSWADNKLISRNSNTIRLLSSNITTVFVPLGLDHKEMMCPRRIAAFSWYICLWYLTNLMAAGGLNNLIIPRGDLYKFPFRLLARDQYTTYLLSHRSGYYI
jgi:hypothetical protein